MVKINKFNAPVIAISAAVILAIGKAVAGFLSGSLAVLSSAADSLSDIVSSMLNLFLIKKADAPPDKEHPFGHGKMEAYSTIIQSVIIFCSGLFLIYKALSKGENDAAPVINSLTIGAMVASIIVSFFISRLLSSTAKKEGSQALEADAAHYTIDLLTNSGILLTIIIIKQTGLAWVDSAVAAVLSLYIMKSAVKLHIAALKILLDVKIPDEELNKIKKLLNTFEKYNINYHKLRTRSDGYTYFIDMHVTLCSSLSLMEAHQFCDILEEKIRDFNSNIDITIHPEPCEGDCADKNCTCQRHEIQKLLKEHAEEVDEAKHKE